MVTDEIIELLGGRDGPIVAPPIEDFLGDLAHGPEVPDRAVAACVIRIDEAAPALLQLLARAADGADLDEAETLQLHRGLHILGGARVEAAWLLLLRFLALPPDRIDRYIGDTVTETLSRIAAGVYDGDADSLFAFVLDASHDEFVRKALIGAATFLTWDDRIETSRMEAFLQSFWDNPAADFDFAWVGWLDAIALLGLEPLVPLAHRAFREGRVDPLLYNRTNFDDELARTKASPDDNERFSENHLGYIEDVLEAIEAIPTDDDGLADDLPDTPDHWLTPSFAGPAEPVRNPWRNVGRNDPCPCGSGKKAKKCCLANQGQPPGFDPG